MRHLLFAALFLLCCAYGCIASVYTRPVWEGKGESVWGPYVVEGVAPEVKERDWTALRIAVDARRLFNGFTVCNDEKVKGSVDDETDVKKFDPEECKALRSFTRGNARLLLQKVFPVAAGMHSERLAVKRKGGNLRIISKTGYVREPCKSYIPEEHRKYGLPNVDFVVYVGLWNEETSTTICSYDEEGRPTSAVIRFNVNERYLNMDNIRSGSDDVVNDKELAVRVVAHEIAHGLGFSTKADAFRQLMNVEDDGKERHMELRSEEITKVLTHYGCGNLKGIRIDDESMDKPYPHFDGKIAKYELMSPYSGVENPMYYSNLMLAVFRSMGYYRVDYAKSEELAWQFIKKSCHKL